MIPLPYIIKLTSCRSRIWTGTPYKHAFRRANNPVPQSKSLGHFSSAQSSNFLLGCLFNSPILQDEPHFYQGVHLASVLANFQHNKYAESLLCNTCYRDCSRRLASFQLYIWVSSHCLILGQDPIWKLPPLRGVLGCHLFRQHCNRRCDLSTTPTGDRDIKSTEETENWCFLCFCIGIFV
jgi:hypothetical protein